MLTEMEIKNKSNMPKYLYHLVPEKIFYSCFSDKKGYDCRNNKDWGMGENFIHTSNSKKILKERVADGKWSNYPIEEKFLLLKIDTNFIESKITYSVYNNIKYYHIHGSLPANIFTKKIVKRDELGKFIL